ncbi:hypothetical protein ACLK18_03120 [Escherichia coli]
MRTYNPYYLPPSQLQKCTWDILHPAFDLCGGEA